MQKKPAQNKAMVTPPVAKMDGVTIVTASTLLEAVKDEPQQQIRDGKAYLRRPDCKHLQENLTREQRIALARRGIKVVND